MNRGSMFSRAMVCIGPLGWPCVPRSTLPRVFLPEALCHLPSHLLVCFAYTWPTSLSHIPFLAPGALFEFVTLGWVAIAKQGQVEAEFKSLMNRGPDWTLPQGSKQTQIDGVLQRRKRYF